MSITSSLNTMLTLGKNLDPLSVNHPEYWSTWQDEILNTVLSADGYSGDLVTGAYKRPSESPDAKAANEWDRANRQAAAVLRHFTSQDTRRLYKDKKTGVEIYAALKAKFEKSSFASRASIRAAFHSVEHDITKPVDSYIKSIEDLRDQLQAVLGDKELISDNYCKDILLQNLDPAYHATRNSLLAQSSGEPDLQTVKDVLLAAPAPGFDPAIQGEAYHDVGAKTARSSGDMVEALTVHSGRSFGSRGRGGGRNGGYGHGGRGRGGGNDENSRGGGHEDGDGFIDHHGNRWGDMSNDGCHRCGGKSHKAARCVKDMPQEVKDWCLHNVYETAHLVQPKQEFAHTAFSTLHFVPDCAEYQSGGEEYDQPDFDA